MPIERPSTAPPHGAPPSAYGLRELEPAEGFGGFDDAVEFALDIISWQLPGSDPFVTRIVDGDVRLHRAPVGVVGIGRAGFLGMPLVTASGQQLGSLCIVDRKFPAVDDQTVRRLLDAIGRILVSELEREERERSLRTLAERDRLTGLLNRGSFEVMLRRVWLRARAGEEDSRLVLADVNHLKPVNDEHGHLRGDRLLRDVAEAISEAAREGDPTGRVGGDEFGIVLMGADERGQERFAERLEAALERRSSSGVSPSVALGGTSLAQATSMDEAIARADRQMYRDKRRRFGRRAHPGREVT